MKAKLALATTASLIIAACGGGSSDGAVVDGGIVKGPILGATVCAFLLENGAKGAQLAVGATGGASGQVVNGCYVTGADGSYAFSVTRANADILLEASGGTYCTDELPVSDGACTGGGALVTMTETMTAAARAATGVRSTVFVTPLTTAAVQAASDAGGITIERFAAQFTTLAGQVLGNADVTPSLPPSADTQPYLRQVADFMKDGGKLSEAVDALKQGSTDFGGGGSIPADGVAATINAALVGEYELVFAREPACTAPLCPFADGALVVAKVHTDGRLELGTKTLRKPFHRKFHGTPHLPEIIWRDANGIEYALSDNEGGTFNEINVGDGNQPEPAGYPKFLGQLRQPN